MDEEWIESDAPSHFARSRSKELREEYDHRMAVIRSAEATAHRIQVDQHRPFLLGLLASAILSLFAAVAPLVFFGVLDIKDDATFFAYALLTLFGYVTCISLLLAARRRQRRQRFEFETLMSLFQGEMTRTWDRLDELEKRDRLLRRRRTRGQTTAPLRGEQDE